MKHTPGPWVPKDATLPNSGVTRWTVLEVENGFLVACTGNTYTPKYQDEEANARLMAAAPELLEAATRAIILLKAAIERAEPTELRGIQHDPIFPPNEPKK
jgi:hypothetical protein